MDELNFYRMKIIYALLIGLLFFPFSNYKSQNVNYEVRVSELMAQGDNNDGGGVAGQQDPTWFVWAKDNDANVYGGGQCQHTTNQFNGWWNLPDYTLNTGTNTSATQITIDMECWEEDGCGSNCSYDPFDGNIFSSNFCLNGDDNLASRAVVSVIDFRNDPACQWNEYDVWIDGNGSLPDYGQFWAKIEIKWEYTSFTAGADDAVCDSTLNLSAEGNGTWSVTSGAGGFFSNNNDPNSTFTGQPGQTYTLTWQTLPGCITSTNTDAVNIEIYGIPDPQLSSTADSLCEGENVTLTAQNGTNYDWFINSNGSVIQSGATNTYSTNGLLQGDTVYVTMTDANNCTATDYYAIDVSPLPTLDLGPDITICEGSIYVLDGTTPFVNYLWNNGETGSSINIADSGNYSLTVTNPYGCSATDDIDVSLFTTIFVDLGPDTAVNILDSLTLDAGAGFTSYLWSTGGTAQTEIITETDEYWVEVTDINGCISIDTIIVSIIENNLFLPNMFTPNGDGQNDVLFIYGNGIDEEISFKIYNRWGKVVYETNSLFELQNVGWNGKFNDIDQPSGVYLWTLMANDTNGNPVNFDLINDLKSSGSILLKR